MNSITHSQRYLPHSFQTRFHAVNLYRSGCSVNFVCRRYHIWKASLMRWNKRFDGTKDSLRISLTDQSLHIPTLILTSSLNGLKTFTKGILIYLSVRCMASFALKRGIAGIPLTLQNIQGPWLFFQSPFFQEETKASKVPHSFFSWNQMANGCKICPKRLLCWSDAR